MYVQLEGKQVHTPGSPAGVRTWRASRCAHLEAQQEGICINPKGGGQIEGEGSLHGFAYIFHDIFGKGISLKMTFSGHTLL